MFFYVISPRHYENARALLHLSVQMFATSEARGDTAQENPENDYNNSSICNV